jgi:hypothetical protein
VSQDLVGSAIEGVRLGGGAAGPLRGTLTGTLSVAGKPVLTNKGMPLSTLKTGRYKFQITDRDPKRGLTIQAVKGRSTGLTGVKFVGDRSATVLLSPGKWMYTSGVGKPHYFNVIR